MDDTSVSYHIEERGNFGDGLVFPWERCPIGWVSREAAEEVSLTMRREPNRDYRIVEVTVRAVGDIPPLDPTPPSPEPEPSKLREAAHTLWESFFKSCTGAHPYVQSIGVRTDSIIVMLVRKPMAHERPVPESWEGWPVESVVVGRIGIGLGDDD